MKKLIIYIIYSLILINPMFGQCVKGNCNDGYGTYKYQNAEYEGNWKNEKQHGFGKLTYQNGDYLEGEFYEGFFQGQGTQYTSSEGTYCIGQWEHDKLKDGKTTIKRGSDTIYNGEIKGGKYNGFGLLNLKNKDKYIGDFKDGFYEGQGSYFYADGSKYVGEFKNDKSSGKGIMYYTAGDRFEGNFLNDQEDGAGILYYAKGGKKIGIWKDGVYISGSNINIDTTNSSLANTNIILKLEKNESGLFGVPIKINGVLQINFLMDTGASELFLTPDVVLTLIRTKTITNDDILEGGHYQDAQGNVNSNVRFNIKEIEVGGIKIKNVAAGVANSTEAENLLGQNVLINLQKFMIDYKNETMTIFR